MSGQGNNKALVILLGLTADKKKAQAVSNYFSADDSLHVYTPAIPQRRGLSGCAYWLQRYFADTVIPERFDKLDVLAYISGGIVFRKMYLSWKPANLNRIVYIRSPIQERALQALYDRYHPLLLWLVRGRLLLDIAKTDSRVLPFPNSSAEQGLVIETGISKLAAKLGLSAEKIITDYPHNRHFLPDADAVLTASESHDEVYTSTQLLHQISHFLQTGKFTHPGNLTHGDIGNGNPG